MPRRPHARLLLPAALGLALLSACSSTSESVSCGGVNTPSELNLASLTPALGSTVTNDAIVHSFSVLDNVAFEDIALTATSAHTAGNPDPAISFSYTISDYTTDYTAAAVTWEDAPAHVELAVPVIYQTPDGCAYSLPSPLFSYDITAPGSSAEPTQ